MAPFQAIFWNLQNRDVRYACQSSPLQLPCSPLSQPGHGLGEAGCRRRFPASEMHRGFCLNRGFDRFPRLSVLPGTVPRHGSRSSMPAAMLLSIATYCVSLASPSCHLTWPAWNGSEQTLIPTRSVCIRLFPVGQDCRHSFCTTLFFFPALPDAVAELRSVMSPPG
jgi:hypothetical protein